MIYTSKMNTLNLPLTLIERILAVTIAATAQSALKWGQPTGSSLLVPALTALGPRLDFPAPTHAALMRCWWIDCDVDESVACDLAMLEYLAKMEHGWPHRPLQFTATTMTLASKAGRLDILDWWVTRVGFENIKCNMYTVMSDAAFGGQLHVLKWWLKAGSELNMAYIARYAAQGGHIDILQWCLDQVGFATASRDLKILEALSAASSHGRLNVLEWWLRSGIEIQQLPLLAGACEQGRLDVLEWWHQLSSQPEHDAAKYPPLICTANHLRASLYQCIFEQKDLEYSVFKWWVDSGFVTKELIAAGIGEDPPFPPRPKSVLMYALQWGHAQPVVILDKHELLPRPIPLLLFRSAFQSGSVALMEWMWEEYSAYCPELVAMIELAKSTRLADKEDQIKLYSRLGGWLVHAARHGHIDIMDWMWTAFSLHTAPMKLDFLEDSMGNASKYGHVKVLEWCHEKREQMYPGRHMRKEVVFCCVIDACWGHDRQGDIELVLKWWTSSRHWQESLATDKNPNMLLEIVRDRLWRNGDIAMIEWWCSTQCPMPKELTWYYVEDASDEMLDWAIQQGITISVGTSAELESVTRVVDNASQANRIGILQWLYSRGYPLTCSNKAFRNCSCETFAWWIEFAKSNPDARIGLGRGLKLSSHANLLHRFKTLFGECWPVDD